MQWFIVFIYIVTIPIWAKESILSVHAQQAVAKVVFGHSIINFFIEDGLGYGTGFFVDQQTLVTNYHVIALLLLNSSDSSDFEDLLESSYIEKGEQKYSITDIKNVSVVNDLVVLQVEGYQGPVLELAEEEMHPDDAISIPGFPSVDKNPEYIASIELREIIGRIGKTVFDCSPFEIPLMLDFFGALGGASGSPILNPKGQVIGVLHSFAGEAFACGTETKYLRELLQSHRSQNVSMYDFLKNKIFESLNQAIKEKDINAQYRVGSLLLQGWIPEAMLTNHLSIDNDIHPKMLAVNLVETLAEQGNAASQLLLSKLYVSGLVVNKTGSTAEEIVLIEPDIQQGLQWMKRAADQGLISAQYRVSGILYNGYYINKESEQHNHLTFDKEQALAYLEAAADQNYIPAQFVLDKLKLNSNFRDTVQSINNNGDIVVDDREPIEREAKKAYQYVLNYLGTLIEIAEKGYPDAQYSLGAFYQNNYNIRTAIEWYERAADQGHGRSQLELGKIYYYGYNRADMINAHNSERDNVIEEEAPVIDEIPIEKDEEKAFYWLHRATQNQIQIQDKDLKLLTLQSTEEDTLFTTAMKFIARGRVRIKNWIESDDGSKDGDYSKNTGFTSESDEENIAFEADEE